MKPLETYKGFEIYHADSRSIISHPLDWVHVDYDGPEDSRHGSAATIEECRTEIDEFLWDRREYDLETAIRDIKRAWHRSDGGAGGVESIAAAIDDAMMLVEGITAQDIAETMVEDVR